MSGSRPTFLQRRGHAFYLRVRVPDELREVVGARELHRALHTDSPSAAASLALIYAARLLEVFEMAKTESLDKGQVRALVEAAFADLRQQADRGFRPRTARPEFEVEEQGELARARISSLEDQVSELRFDRSVVSLARHRVVAAGADFETLNRSTIDDLLSGCARAIAEQQRHYLHRLTERILPHAPVDELFHAVPFTGPPASIIPTPLTPRVGPTMVELVERYLAAKKARWTPKTIVNRRQQLRLLLDHLGEGKSASAVSPDDMRLYRDGLIRLRRNHHVGAGRAFATRQTESSGHRIGPRTAAMLLDGTRALFRWATDEGYVATNPAQTIRVEQPKKVHQGKVRRPFTCDEIERIFSSPLWTGCQSLHRRFEAGDRVIWDAKFWAPLVGYYTGMRLGEIIQLHLDDVCLEGEIPHLRVTPDNAGPVGSGLEKSLKSDAAVREVPLHPQLIQLGFREFVERRRIQRKNKGRLFFEVAFGADGVPSSAFSKWFARLLDKCGLVTPDIVFHSFRHLAEDAFRNALQPQYVIDRVIGHSNDAVSSKYGSGVSLKVSYEAVKALKLPVD